jgi:hypothetical protein
MFVYPYKQIRSGKFTKYAISLTADGGVLIEKRFRGAQKAQEAFNSPKSIKGSQFPKNVKEVALWALQDAKGIGLNNF